MFQIEANTCGFECRLIFGANTVHELTSLRRWLPVPGDFLVGALEKIEKHFEKLEIV